MSALDWAIVGGGAFCLARWFDRAERRGQWRRLAWVYLLLAGASLVAVQLFGGVLRVVAMVATVLYLFDARASWRRT